MKKVSFIFVIMVVAVAGCAQRVAPPPADTAAPAATATPDMSAIIALDEALRSPRALDGRVINTGGFGLAMESGWAAAENYDTDTKLAAVDNVYRFQRGKSKMVISALHQSDPPARTDNALEVAQLISWNTSYDWMQYIVHDIVSTPLGDAICWQVSTTPDSPFNDEDYIAMSIFLPTDAQILNISISLPASASAAEQAAHWQELGNMLAGASYSAAEGE